MRKSMLAMSVLAAVVAAAETPCRAVVPGVAEAAVVSPKRLIAHRGFPAVAPENTMPSFGAAVALDAAEIEFDLWWTTDGEIVTVHDDTLSRVSDGEGKVYQHSYAELAKLDFGAKSHKRFAGLRIARFEDILRKFSCQTIMNIHLKTIGEKPWNEEHLKKVISLIDEYGARKHVYFMTSVMPLQKQLIRLAPDIPRCMGAGGRENVIERALEAQCSMIQCRREWFTPERIKRAHEAGLRCNVFWSNDPDEAKMLFAKGIDTILTDDYLRISSATGVK